MFKKLSVLLTSVCIVIFSLVFYYDKSYPDKIYTSNYNNAIIGNCSVEINKSSLTVSANKGTYNSVIKLFGIVPVKDVSLSVVPEKSVVVSGAPFGVMLYSQGVMVVGCNSFATKKGNVNPSQIAGIKVGDIILRINSKPMTSIEDVTHQVLSSEGRPLAVEYKRGSEIKKTTIIPQKGTDDSRYHIGLWVRDSSAGIGIISFFDPDSGVAVGFGHPICDADTGNRVEISNGTAVSASVYSVRKSSKGNPGELLGTLKIRSPLGKVIKNENNGVYFDYDVYPQGQPMPIAYSCEVKKGKAQIYTDIDGDGAKYYDVQIESINPSETTKNLVLKITDKGLISKTGGIVQGMSGSPILQNGKLVGAITHVLVDDPTKGYGIFAEDMLETAQSVAESNKLKEAS